MIQYKKVAFYTLGCKLNFSETSTISRLFEDAGFAKVEFEEHPDIYVINTCSVTENADKKCKQLVKKALSINPNAFIAIIGCFAQLNLKILRTQKNLFRHFRMATELVHSLKFKMVVTISVRSVLFL